MPTDVNSRFFFRNLRHAPDSKDGLGTGFHLRASEYGKQCPRSWPHDSIHPLAALYSQALGSSSITHLKNAPQVGIDAIISSFTISTRLTGPVDYLNAAHQQGGILVSSQDNHAKFVG